MKNESYECGGFYKNYDMSGTIYTGTGIVKVHDIFDKLPDFMLQADCLFCDTPGSGSIYHGFYRKADMETRDSFSALNHRFFECVDEIKPKTLFIEVFSANKDFFFEQSKSRYKHVKAYNTTYYRRNKCWIIQASDVADFDYPFEGMDEQDVIEYICKNHPYDCIGDLFMGRGLVGFYANKYGKKFVGTELNKKRLAVLLERIKQGKLKV